MQGVRLVRMSRQHLPIEHLGLRQPPGAVMLDGQA
jgi:hypothetical protein